jgi:hypothetical protein
MRVSGNSRVPATYIDKRMTLITVGDRGNCCKTPGHFLLGLGGLFISHLGTSGRLLKCTAG